MSLLLSTKLREAQDYRVRSPIVEILSVGLIPSIPFEGQELDGREPTEKPNAILHSTDRLVIVAIYNNRYIRYVYTDDERTQFYYSDIAIGRSVLGVSHCELPGGNIGLIYIYSYRGVYYLEYKIITVQGDAVSEGSIGNWSTSQFTSEPYVVRLSDGSYYLVCARDGSIYAWTSSSDFETWGSGAEISFAALTGTVRNPHLHIDEDGGDLMLFVDHVDDVGDSEEELINCYMAISSDGGASWGDATAITTYDDFDATGSHPVFKQYSDDSGVLAHTKNQNILKIDENASGYCSSRPDNISIPSLSIDLVNRKLFFVDRHTSSGPKVLHAVGGIDIDAWGLTDCWGYDTIPAFNEYFKDSNGTYVSHYGNGPYVCAGIHDNVLAVVDTVSDVIRNYAFDGKSSYGIEMNISGYEKYREYESLAKVFVDNDFQKIWFLFHYGYALSGYHIHIGYIDLSQTEGPYSFYSVYQRTISRSFHTSVEALRYCVNAFHIDEANDRIVLLFGPGHPSMYKIPIKGILINISEKATEKDLLKTELIDLPRIGFRGGCYTDGEKLYSDISYSDASGEQDKRGLCEIDISSDDYSIRYYRPTYGTYDNYYLANFSLIESTNDLLMSGSVGVPRVARFNLDRKTWIEYTPDNTAGFNPWSGGFPFDVKYDPITETIFAGWISHGVTAFNLDGSFHQTNYATATKAAGEWAFGESSKLVKGYDDKDAAVVLDPDDDGIYAFWEHNDELIKWAKEDPGVDLSSYLIRDAGVERTETIDTTPGSVSFSVSHGHLFDPFNAASMLSYVLLKGRQIKVRMGEKIDGVDHFVEQGSYIVTELSMRYERGDYPVAGVRAEDKRILWNDVQVLATPQWSADPVHVFKEILKTHGGIIDTDFEAGLSLSTNPLFTPNTFKHQYVDEPLTDIIDQMLSRYGLFLKFRADGKISVGTIFANKSISHVYRGSNANFVNFTPDDSYSDFTNRVTVEAQEEEYTRVIFAEESVESLSGTVGWWGYKNDFRVWYSNDRQRKCRDPRLEIVESTTSIGFKLSGSIDEQLYDDDKTERSCKVVVEAPNLIPVLLAGISMYIAASKIPDGISIYTMSTIPWGRILEQVSMVAVMLVVSAVGNFQYEIHARPIGNIQRTIQAQVDDLEHQVEIGTINEQRFFDPLCGTVNECKEVAKYELMIAQLQRKRITASKIADLRDEQGDVIEIDHPYSGFPMKVFITNLTRKLRVGSPGGNDGSFYDHIEGWVL